MPEVDSDDLDPDPWSAIVLRRSEGRVWVREEGPVIEYPSEVEEGATCLTSE